MITTRRIVAVLVGAMILGHLPAIFIEEAHADPAADDHFVSMLENAGMTYTDRDAVINDGHLVCYGLWSGETTDTMASQILDASPMLAPPEAGVFVSIAVQAFCPDIGAHYRKQTMSW